MEDGTLVPIEITKTIIAADGSRSVTREVPEYVKNARAVGNRALSALENKDHITESRKEFQHSKAYRADDGKIILNRTETTNVYQTKIPAKQPNQSKSLNQLSQINQDNTQSVPQLKASKKILKKIIITKKKRGPDGELITTSVERQIGIIDRDGGRGQRSNEVVLEKSRDRMAFESRRGTDESIEEKVTRSLERHEEIMQTQYSQLKESL